MAGKNQHHLPQFLQRGFAIARTRRRRIWRFAVGEEPENCEIKRTGAEPNFYSEPATDGSRTLDDEITDQESPMARLLEALRTSAIGDPIAATDAAALIIHLAPKTAHFRATMERGMRQLASGASSLFTDPDRLEALLGLDEDVPTARFHQHIEETIAKQPAFAALKVPVAVLERVAFYLAKENFESVVSEAIPVLQTLFRQWLDTSTAIVRDSHNQALSRTTGPNLRQAFLEGLVWTIEAAPEEGAILPDCVALAISAEGECAPFMLGGGDDVQVVVMPLCSASLMVGRIPRHDLPADFSFNREAARVSHHFYLAANDDARLRGLQSLLGERSASIIDDALTQTFRDYLPIPAEAEPPDDASLGSGGDTHEATTTPWQYQLSLPAGVGQETIDAVVDAVQRLVSGVGQTLPLQRLDGVTVADNYPAALAGLDRGYDGARPPQTVDASIGVGIAQAVTIVRAGVVKSRIVIRSNVALALISDKTEDVDWAVHVFVNQLALVAMVESIDRAFPGVQLKPVADEFQGWLYQCVDGAMSGYFAAHVSAGFGDAEANAWIQSQLLSDAINRMRTSVTQARLAYRRHGQLGTLLGVALPAVQQVLLFAADHLGHCSALGLSPVADGELSDQLEQAGLKNWLMRYQRDLETFRQGIGRWRSFDELLAFNVHVERLMWQLGMIPWKTPEGRMHIEIPIATDAMALMTAEADTDPKVSDHR